MAIDRDQFIPALRDSFSAYYDIYDRDSALELPLAFRADYFSRAEKFWLSKKITVWANETNEFAYIFSAAFFSVEDVDKCVGYAMDEGLPRIKPHKEHQYTHIKVLFVADSFDTATRKHIEKLKFSKNYHFSLWGFTELKAAAVDMSEEKAYPNRAGYELSKYFSKLFAAERKKLCCECK